MLRQFLLIAVCMAICFGADLVLSTFIEDYVVRIINMCGIGVILAVSLNVINGLTGQFSLGHAGFMAIGAYVSAYFTTTLRYFDPLTGTYIAEAPMFADAWGFVPAMLIGGIVAAVAGLLVGIPTLRLRGDYLAITTLGFSEIVNILITNFSKVGGANGLPGLPPYSNTFMIFAVVCICVIFSINLQRSTFGRALIAVRENELAAETMGIRVARMKVMAFTYGAFFAGVAGALLGHFLQTISPGTFNFMKSIEVVVMIVLGGLGSLTGAVVGAIVMTALPEALRDFESQIGVNGIRMVIYSFVLILLMLFRPQGLFGQRELSLKLLRRLLPGSRKGDT
ncbi:High-affinity branched-chain amino acid transport system permease protein LivH [Planctomycetaceae bacterium]|nr:High-affinity branched-chain amino acid transport system permease protein LivH [Planctomycetaceae bacterium]